MQKRKTNSFNQEVINQYPDGTKEDDIYSCEICDIFFIATVSKAKKGIHSHNNEVPVRKKTLIKFGFIENER